MGGCRCTYRDCIQRTDGKTHFFHYPVFDKLRCHQWLTNAQRLEFLSLKLSQLKNRVICQHHFKDEMFMNYMKEKLTCTAVPVLPGPYCSLIDSADVKNEDEMLSPINPEYIENEVLNINSEKKAKFSVKYGDFLTNCEVMELVSVDQLKPNNTNSNSNTKPLKPRFIKPKGNKNKNSEQLNHLQPVSNNIQPESHAYVISDPSNISFKSIQNSRDNQNKGIEIEMFPPSNMYETSGSRKSKVKIISEEKYTQPLPAINSLVPVSPSFILHPSEKSNYYNEKQHYYLQIENPVRIDTVGMQENQNLIPGDMTTDYSKTDRSEGNTAARKELEKMDMEASYLEKDTEKQHYYLQIENPVRTDTVGMQENQNLIPEDIITDYSKTDLLEGNTAARKELEKMDTEASYLEKDAEKSPELRVKKLSDERAAAIEQKRKFNKRLKDIVSDSLNRLDEQDNPYNNFEYLKNKNVASHLTTESKLPNLENYLVKYLDARMNRMENTLLNRIDRNSHHISQLTNTLKEEKSKKAETKTVSTQTTLDIKSNKRKLYDEVSRYLSLETKSKLFEELFIDKKFLPIPRKRRSMRNSIDSMF